MHGITAPNTPRTSLTTHHTLSTGPGSVGSPVAHRPVTTCARRSVGGDGAGMQEARTGSVAKFGILGGKVSLTEKIYTSSKIETTSTRW